MVAGCANYYVRYSISTQSSMGHLMAVSEDVEKILRKKKNVGVKSPNMVVPPRLPRMSLPQLRTQGIDVGKRTRRWTPLQAVGTTLQVKHFQHNWRVSDSSQCAQRFFKFTFLLTRQGANFLPLVCLECEMTLRSGDETVNGAASMTGDKALSLWF